MADVSKWRASLDKILKGVERRNTNNDLVGMAQAQRRGNNVLRQRRKELEEKVGIPKKKGGISTKRMEEILARDTPRIERATRSMVEKAGAPQPNIIAHLMRGIRNTPTGALVTGAAFAAPFIESIAENFVDSTKRKFTGTGINEPSVDDLERLKREQALNQIADQLERERVQRLVDQNTQMIMQLQPELAQQLLAGRRLPQGAVVFGGQPRTDLLEQVAHGMVRGQYAPQGGPSLTSQLASSSPQQPGDFLNGQ